MLRGLDWAAGDEIVITAEEESALLLPCLQLRDLFGIKVVKVPLVDDVAGQVQAVAECLTDRTKLLAFSHVTTDTGFRLPAKDVCALARDRGVLSFVDMAHSAGLYPMALGDIGCDFAGILSYKWMYSPYAAGVLYIDEAKMDALRVTYAGGRAQSRLDFHTDEYALRESAERFQYGPWSWPLVHAWAVSLDYLTDIGLDAIWNRTVALTTRLKEGLLQIPGCRLLTPKSPELSAALVSFEMAGWDDIRDALRQRWQIVIKAMPHHDTGLRSSVPFFLLEEEVDLLLEKLMVLVHEKSQVLAQGGRREKK